MILYSPVARSVLPTLSREFYAPYSFRYLVTPHYARSAGRICAGGLLCNCHALPGLSYDPEALMGPQEDYQTEREGTVTRGNLDGGLYFVGQTREVKQRQINYFH